MKSLPEEIDVSNIKNFQNLYYEDVLCSFRKYVYDTIVKRKDETEYVDLDFLKKYFTKHLCSKKIVEKICSELHELGWKTKLSYGDTGLFIYTTENPPHNCW